MNTTEYAQWEAEDEIYDEEDMLFDEWMEGRGCCSSSGQVRRKIKEFECERLDEYLKNWREEFK